MTGKDLADKYCMSCGLGLYNCTLIVNKCPYIKAQMRLAQRIKELEYGYEKVLQDGDENEIAYREGELEGSRNSLEVIESII